MSHQKTAYFLSYLMIIVYRAGGRLKIDNLSDFSHRIMNLGMELDKENNSVVLTCSEVKPKDN